MDFSSSICNLFILEGETLKKYLILLLNVFIIFLGTSCGEPIKDDNNKSEIKYDSVCISTDKTIFNINEKITLYLHNTDDNDLVAITEYGKEPTNTYSILKRVVKGTTEQVFNANKLNGAGDYTIFLFENGCEVIDYINIHIDDEDTNNYMVKNALLNIDDNNLSSVTINTDFKNELTYRLFWAKDNCRLDDYMAIKTIKIGDHNSFTIDLPKNLYIPHEANQIEVFVVEGVSSSYYLDISEELKTKQSKHIFTFNALTDIHIQNKNASAIYNSHLKMALRDIYSSDSEAIFVAGDIINMSVLSDYTFYKGILEEERTDNAKDIYYALGNHEYMYQDNIVDAINLFKEQFNLENHYYSIDLLDYKFIMLGSDDISSLGKMNNIQLSWLREELAKTDKNKPTFIFLHQPLKDTIAGSLDTLFGQLDYGFGSSTHAIRDTLKNYPNAILFSGHSHYTLEEYQAVLYGNGMDASFVHCGSMSYLNGFGTTDLGGAEGFYVEVYEDYILLKGKEFIYDKWLGGAQFIFPITKL